MPRDGLSDYRFTAHARDEMRRRQLSEAETVRPDRSVFQSRLTRGDPPKTYLLRVFVDTDRHPPEVVTAYRTSKVEKYWR